MNAAFAVGFVSVIAGTTIVQIDTAQAETVEVAPGVKITKKSFSAPPNQQPFYGFIDKTADMRGADQAFIETVVKLAGTREKASQEIANRGWKAVSANDFSEAAKRFNQAFLLSPEQSQVYHGLAIVVAARFQDLTFAEELFQIALKQPGPLPSVNADYGRLLLIAKRPRDAQPVLEQAVKDIPQFASAWSNLGVAKFQNGDAAGACSAAAEAVKFANTEEVKFDIEWIRREAKCS